ncbi:hypothetical protein ACHAXA_010359 [Cyclostephanos tholiformis]|uniref:MYND-type domain-containing protein n=1 Tax=Cyclostephanos tholiformis TaxID=382380 RepID=A0ABD3RV17_9STRA
MAELTFFTDWKYCSACGLPASQTKLLTCAGCSCAAYHNSSCQRSHWTIHKLECKELTSAMLPLKQLVRWHTTHKKSTNVAGDEKTSVGASGSRVRCWWEPNVGNGITEDTLIASNSMWGNSLRRWRSTDYLGALEGFKKTLEPFNRAWSYMNESNDLIQMSGNDVDAFLHRSLVLANRLLFCAFCEMDRGQVESGRQKLVQSISITMALFFTFPMMSSRDSIRSIMDDAWMELMLSMEEVPQHRIAARHVAALAIATKSCMWSDPCQRPGYMARNGLSGIPYTPPENHPTWCRVFENNWFRILNEYIRLNSTPSNFSNVGCGKRGSGHDDHLVVSGRGWKEYVLFGTGSEDNDSDAPFTKQLLQSTIPDAVALAEDGGGEIIFSCLSPRTHIKPHCGPTNLRWTAHLGLVIPNSASDCRIRVRDDWYSWQVGKIFLFDDSYEHEVRNDTDDARVVLLIRLWHPQLANMASFQRESILSEAMAWKEEEVRKRYHPPN